MQVLCKHLNEHFEIYFEVQKYQNITFTAVKMTFGKKCNFFNFHQRIIFQSLDQELRQIYPPI